MRAHQDFGWPLEKFEPLIQRYVRENSAASNSSLSESRCAAITVAKWLISLIHNAVHCSHELKLLAREGWGSCKYTDEGYLTSLGFASDDPEGTIDWLRQTVALNYSVVADCQDFFLRCYQPRFCS